jgi:glycosyltransferase involved in cell wall biosynthesis
MRISLVHDWLNQLGGAEDVLARLVRLFPGAPVHTSIYWRDAMPEAMREWDIRPSWMDRLPGIYRHHQPYLPLYPLAFGGMRIAGCDVVLSNKSGFCHGVRTPGTPHVCYCLTPTRYVWNLQNYVAAGENIPALAKVLLPPLIGLLKRWDHAAAQRVTAFVAISSAVRDRIARFYGRESAIIYPPVDTDRFRPVLNPDADAFLVVSRLIPYKRVDLAVRACTALGLPLIVGGSGREREVLERIAGPTVRFVGYVPDDELPGLMANCRAFLFPGLDDFGITPVQAGAAGRPVIAFRGGGALDTVIEGKTGAFFDEPTAESLMDALRAFDPADYEPAACRENALRFDRAVFDRAIAAKVAEYV